MGALKRNMSSTTAALLINKCEQLSASAKVLLMELMEAEALSVLKC